MNIMASISDIFNQNSQFCDKYHEKRISGTYKQYFFLLKLLRKEDLIKNCNY